MKLISSTFAPELSLQASSHKSPKSWTPVDDSLDLLYDLEDVMVDILLATVRASIR